MPGPRSLASGLLLAAALLLAPVPAVRAGEGEDDPDREEVYPALVSLDPVRRTAPAGTEVRIKFRLRAGLRTPILVVVFPDGAAAYVRPDTQSGNDYQIPFRLDDLGGTHRVALMGFDPSGERVTAKFVVKALGKDGKAVDRDIDLPPADTKYAPLDPAEHPLRLERYFFHRMNALRKRQGRAALPWHEPVARSARAMLAEAARHWEETYDARLGYGLLLHRVPGAGPGGSEGPTLADRVRLDHAWPSVVPRLPGGPPQRGRGNANYVSESLASADTSLERKFEQVFLRKSDLRAPMLSEWTTHAAGAATWRTPAERPGPKPAPQAFGALVFIQVNDPAADACLERERAEVRAAVSGASGTEEKAAAWRRTGQSAFPDAPKVLEDACGRAREPAVLAGALDGLWLCAPDAARRRTEPLRLKAVQALEEKEEAAAAAALVTLSRIRYDAASAKAGVEGLAEVSRRALEMVKTAEIALKEGRTEDARTLLAEGRRRFAGFPEEGDVKAAQRLAGSAGEAPPR